eukprot:5963256-Prymnesium_polylepis.1
MLDAVHGIEAERDALKEEAAKAASSRAQFGALAQVQAQLAEVLEQAKVQEDVAIKVTRSQPEGPRVGGAARGRVWAQRRAEGPTG